MSDIINFIVILINEKFTILERTLVNRITVKNHPFTINKKLEVTSLTG